MLGRAAQPGKSDERVEAGLNDAWTRSNQRSGPEIEPFGSMPAPSKAHPNSVRDVTRAIPDRAGQYRVVFYGLPARLGIETGSTQLSWY